MSEIAFPKDLVEVEKYNQYMGMVVANQRDAEFATDLRKSIKDEISQIEKTRKSFTEPLLESKKRIDEQAKRLTFPRLKLMQSLNDSLLKWHESQEEVRLAEEQRKREEELKALEIEKQRQRIASETYGDEGAAQAVVQIGANQRRLEEQPIEIIRNTKTATATAYVSTYWDFEVIDEKEIPKEYFTLNEVAIRKVCVALKEKTNIPGIKAVQKKRMGG